MKKNMLSNFILSWSVLIGLSNQMANANSCNPGTVSYKKSHFVVLKDFVSHLNNLNINESSGNIRISSLNDEVIETYSGGYKSKFTVLSSYGQISDELGLKVRKSIYILETNKACDDFSITSILSEPEIDIGMVDPKLSMATREAIGVYLSDANIVPSNSHSGDFSIRIHTPEICVDGKRASVNIVRSNHQPAGIAYKTTTVLVDLEMPGAIRNEVHPGRFLRNLCD